VDKKFLAEYDSRERSAEKKFLNNFVKGKVTQYPPSSRFGGLKEPIVHSDPQLHAYDKEPIWSQIPLSGTLIISIMNVSERMCLKNNGFAPNEIPDLIKFANETGKIRFGLGTKPLNYEGLDYLEPYFENLNPPLFYQLIMLVFLVMS